MPYEVETLPIGLAQRGDRFGESATERLVQIGTLLLCLKTILFQSGISLGPTARRIPLDSVEVDYEHLQLRDEKAIHGCMFVSSDTYQMDIGRHSRFVCDSKVTYEHQFLGYAAMSNLIQKIGCCYAENAFPIALRWMAQMD